MGFEKTGQIGRNISGKTGKVKKVYIPYDIDVPDPNIGWEEISYTAKKGQILETDFIEQIDSASGRLLMGIEETQGHSELFELRGIYDDVVKVDIDHDSKNIKLRTGGYGTAFSYMSADKRKAKLFDIYFDALEKFAKKGDITEEYSVDLVGLETKKPIKMVTDLVETDLFKVSPIYLI